MVTKYFTIADWLIDEWEKTYSPLNVAGELEKMVLWLDANPKRRKKNYNRFVINWLNKAHAQVVSAEVSARVEREQRRKDAGVGAWDGKSGCWVDGVRVA